MFGLGAARRAATAVTDESAVATVESCASASRYITSLAPGRSRGSFCSDLEDQLIDARAAGRG